MFINKIFAQETGTISINQPSNFNITQISDLITAIVSVLLIIAAMAAFLYLVIGGIQWITSGGDKAGMEAARNKITHAIIGLIIVASAYAIMVVATSFLGLDLNSLEYTLPF
jgi:hypothetical protein